MTPHRVIKQWQWDDDESIYTVEILRGGTLRWGGYQKVGRQEGGSQEQPLEDFLRTREPVYRWMSPPQHIIDQLVAELNGR